MCGICGFVHHGYMDEQTLCRMNETIRYRGPDDEGYLLENVRSLPDDGELVHNRLSILDLSALGHQPMNSPDGRLTICYN